MKIILEPVIMIKVWNGLGEKRAPPPSYCPDGMKMPQFGTPAKWVRGSTAEVAWAIAANHGKAVQVDIRLTMG